MDADECRSEASFGMEDSNTTSSLGNGGSNSTSVRTTEGCSPSDRKKRKRISPNSSPKVSDGFGDSEAGELLTKIPELAEAFSIVSKVGEGTFSNVYLAKMHEFPDELLALKHIIPTSAPGRIENELKCLQEIGGQDNVIGVQTTLRCRDHVVLALPYFPHQKFQDYLLEMSVCEIKDYMKNLFIALNRVHVFQVIHRDVKPSNFLYSRQHGRYSLVDFGLAMKVPGSSDSLLDSPREPQSKRARTTTCTQQSPKNSKAPRRRSTRLSPTAIENKDLAGTEVKHGPDSRSILKPSSINSANWKFAHQAKGFKVPARNVGIKSKRATGGAKILAGSKQHSVHRGSQLLCPLKHVAKEICTICMARAHQNTPRAGTPGFRSPEVLLKHPNQTPAVDMWSAGVILLCILSGRYPFFRAYDDMTALAQIITIQGSKEAADAAQRLGKDLVLGSESPAGDLKVLCQRLRRGETKTQSASCSRKREKLKSSGESSGNTTKCSTSSLRHERCSFCQSKKRSRNATKPSRSVSDSAEADTCACTDNTDGTDAVHLDGRKCPCTCSTCCWAVPDTAYDLLRRCLDLDPEKRISAAEALEHVFFIGG